MELEKIQKFIQQASGLHLSGCKVNYDYSLLTTGPADSYKLNLFGMTSFPDFQVNKENLSNLGHFFLQIKSFELKYESKVWDTYPGKFLVIGFIEEVTEDVLNILRKWENCDNPKFGFFLIVFKKNLVLQNFEKIVVKKGKKQIRDNFKVGELPWVSVVYESYEVFKGKLEKFYLPDWENFTKKYSVIETLSFFVEYNEIVVFNCIKKTEKIIDLSGIVVIDFFDESCQHAYMQDEDLGKKVKYYKIYSGVDGGNFRYSLENLGLQHPTAEKLFLIDCPSTFLFCNQKLMWRGNRFYEDFTLLISTYTDGSHYATASTTEENLVQNFNEIKNSLIQDDLDLLIDVKLEVLVYVSSWEILEKKFRSRLVVCLDEESEKFKAENIFDQLKSVLPNLHLEITERQNLFTTAYEPVNSNKGNSKKKLKKQSKIEQMDSLIESLKNQISQFEIKLNEKNEVIEKQNSVIHELKSSNLGKLHKRVDLMIEEKMKSELEKEEKNKQIRELVQKVSSLKSQLEYNDSLCEKRDGQLNNLIQKIKNQEMEISKLTVEVNKKSRNLVNLQGEITELRPSKEALQTVEKQSKIIKELKKQIKDQDNEINILKDIIKATHHYTPDSSVMSPSKLPRIMENRSGKLSVKAKLKSNSISKSTNSRALKRYTINDYIDDDEEEIKKLEEQRIEQIEKDRLEKIEKERLEEIERIKIEKENEEREMFKMEIEESICKEFYKELARKEQELKAEKEMKKKQEELKSKPTVSIKGKTAAKAGSKPVKKK